MGLVKLEKRPVRGDFSEWRVLLVNPFSESIEGLKGARNRKCSKCLPDGQEFKPENLADLEFYWNDEQGFVYSVCPRCGAEMGGYKISPGNGRKKGQSYRWR